jgi:hypothetical protein
MPTTIATGYIYLTTGTLSGGPPYTTITGGIIVPIKVQDFEDSADNSVKVLPRRETKSSASSRDYSARAIQTGNIIRNFKITGKINDDTDGSINQKRTGLLHLVGMSSKETRNIGAVNMVAHQDTFQNTDDSKNSVLVAITKWKIKQNSSNPKAATVDLSAQLGGDTF